MKKIVLVPDSFKGTISSVDVCRIMKEEIMKCFPEAEIVSIPVADGGEGTAECFIYGAGAKAVRVRTEGPYGEPLEAVYAGMGDTAVIESAMAAGLPLAEAAGRLDPSAAGTRGVGLMIRQAVLDGYRNIVLGLGGSSTNDAGAGLAEALGVRFTDCEGKQFVPTGATLGRICGIDCSEAVRFLEGVSLKVLCDIDNPLYGKSGAAYVFAPQKGADEQMVEMLDRNLRAFAEAVFRETGKKIDDLPGGGAAGGMGAGCAALLNGKLCSGIDTVLSIVNFEKQIQGADVIFTGEGRMDSQSLRGKVISGVAERARSAGVPVVAVVGDACVSAGEAAEMGVAAVVPTCRKAEDFSSARFHSREDLRETMRMICRLEKVFVR